MGVLSHQQIRALIEGPEPLLSDFVDLDAQLQANGFDMTLRAIGPFTGPGNMGSASADRHLPDTSLLSFDDGRAHLAPGAYLVQLNEVVRMPESVMAVAKPRSSLLRSGVAVHNAVWDAGYHGRSQALMVVYNPHGFTVALNARILQLVFMTLDAATDSPYAGHYQREQL